ncbi:MAG: hypothetical protein ACRD12_02010 [Acidimicrobiales bacterium]
MVLGVLLLASVTLLPWHSGGPAPTSGGGSGRTAIQAPGALLGIAAALVAAALVAWLAVATLPRRPLAPRPSDTVLLAGSAIALVLVVVKLVADPEDLAIGAWASIGFSAALIALRATRRLRSSIRG